MLGNDDARGAKGRCAASDRAKVVGILDAVEEDDQRRPRAGQQRGRVCVFELSDAERDALMDDITYELADSGGFDGPERDLVVGCELGDAVT